MEKASNTEPIYRVNAMTEAEILELLRCDEVLEPEDQSTDMNPVEESQQ